MNNRENFQKKIETRDFMHMNDSVLRTLNVISDSKCHLSSLAYSFRNVDHYCLVDYVSSIKKIEKTAKICYNENNHKLKAIEKHFFIKQIAIFCDTDDFCKAYEKYCRNKLLIDKEKVIPRTRMSLSEIMTLLIPIY